MSVAVDQGRPLVAVAHYLHDERGFHAFPVDHPGQPVCTGKHGPTTPCDGQRGKHPAVKFGTWAVTVTSQMIDAAWATRGGLANVGIACGPSNLVVLDGDEAGVLRRWAAARGVTLTDTYTVTTARGEHMYYRWDHQAQGRIGNSPKAVKGFKIDVRGDGGYVIAEGSLHASGVTYTGNGLPVAELQPAVAQLLLAGAAEPEPVDQHDGRSFWDSTAADPNSTKIANGERHNALIAYAGRLRNSGLDYQEALPSYHRRWLLVEQPVGQIPEAVHHSADCQFPVTWQEAEAKLRDVYARYPAGRPAVVDGPTQAILASANEAVIDASFWPSRPVLQHVEKFARARRVPPWSMLGAVLVRAIARIPPYVLLPPMIGSTTSLNFFAAIVGPPGAGKDASDDAAGDAFTWGRPQDATPFFSDSSEQPVTVPLGTGEGVARTYRPIGTKPDEPNQVVAAIFSASEIDTWTSIEGRSGATITPILRTLFTGKQFGFANAGKDTRVMVERDSYRACLFVGVQPLKSGPLLRASDGGLPQRFVWFTTSDVDAPGTAPPAPTALPDPSPDWMKASDVDRTESSPDEQTIVLHIPDAARAAIDAHRVAVLHVDPDVDPLDGHVLVVRAKVAAGLMALDGRTSVTDEDWQLAGTVMEVSKIVRDACQRAIDDAAKRANRARGHDEAERAQIREDRLTTHSQKRVADAIYRKLSKVRQATKYQLRQFCSASIRSEFEAVLETLLEHGAIVVCQSDGNEFRQEYALASNDEEGVS